MDGRLQELFREILEEPLAVIEVDRAHRALGPRAADQDRPQDVVCRLLRYAQKERIIRKAWEHGTVSVNGAQVKVLPDLSRAPLRRRAKIKTRPGPGETAGLYLQVGISTFSNF